VNTRAIQASLLAFAVTLAIGQLFILNMHLAAIRDALRILAGAR
jgi:hypothetical protein